MVKCVWTKEVEASGFRFVKNDQSYEILTETSNKILIKIWKLALRNLLIVTDFRQIYKYMETVGEGTFAKVYKIRRLKDSKFFASKALAKNQVKDKKDLAALVNEIKLLKKLG